MSATIVGVGDPKALKRYSAFLAVDVGRESYFNRKFMGVGADAQTPIQVLPQLENDAGDQISYDLVMQLKMQPVEGDTTLSGKEEDLKFATDNIYIDQMRSGVNTGGKMSRKRTIHDLRTISRRRQGEWWAKVFDELLFIYLSGARGTNSDYIFPTSYAGFAGNALTAPDAQHMIYGDAAGTAATAKANVSATTLMTLNTIERCVARTSTMGGGTLGIPAMQPVRIEGEDTFCLLMHPWQAFQLRNNTSTGQWLDIQKATAAAVGMKSPIFSGALGMHAGVVLHSHRSVVRFSDYGAGANLPAARALFMGRQAGVVAFGSAGTGLRFDWNEELEDRGNQVVITCGSIFGVKKTTFTSPVDNVSRDMGVMAVDTFCADPS
ncbi:MAG: N4-gp56 family major capsid protein [Burkholderiales bacterium]|nr:N4-gp56 family major capsid protein [Burkholderiales bacterium]